MKFFRPFHIRFRDLDAIGHVNNAVYHTFVEDARIDYFKEILGTKNDWQSFGVLIARSEINYIHELLYGDEVECGLQCVRLGNKSMQIDFSIVTIRDGERIEASNGTSVLVCFDHTTKSSARIPDWWREKFYEYEGKIEG